MQAMGVDDVQAALDALGLEISIREFASPTATSQQAAEAIGCALGQIVKSLGFFIDKKQAALVLASGDKAVDERKLAAHFSVGRKKVRLMRPDQCLAILGYAPGGVPPLAHRTAAVTVLLDDCLRRYQTVYAAGGSAKSIFPIALAALARATGGEFVYITRD